MLKIKSKVNKTKITKQRHEIKLKDEFAMELSLERMNARAKTIENVHEKLLVIVFISKLEISTFFSSYFGFVKDSVHDFSFVFIFIYFLSVNLIKPFSVQTTTLYNVYST